MITVSFTHEEQEALVELLDTSIDDLRDEIRETDRSNYKEMLRRQRETLLIIKQKIQNELVVNR